MSRVRLSVASACAVAALCFLAAACGGQGSGETAAPAPGAEVTLVLTGGTVVPGTTAPPIEDAVVVIAGESIVEVGAREDIDIAEGSSAEVLDVSGLWLIPGLMDLHAHPGVFEGDEQREVLETLLALGVTTIRSTSVNSHGGGPELKARLESGELVGPRLRIAGPLIDLEGSQSPSAATVATEEEIRAEVRKQAASGVDYIKLYSRLTLPLVAAAIGQADSLGVKVLGHLGRTGWMEAARLGIDGVTHSGPMGPTWELLPESEQPAFREMFAPGSEGAEDLFERWVATLPPSQEKIDELTATLKQNGVEVNPNLVLMWAISHGHEQATYDALEIHLAPATDREAWGDGPPNPMAAPLEYVPLEKRVYAHSEALVRHLHDNGVLITAGSDFPMDWMTPGPSLHVELQRLHAAGIPAAEVLRIGTANGAKALGLSDRLGTIEAGKLADIVVLSADPLEDIANTRAVTLVVKGGRLFRPEELLRHR